MDYQFEGKRFRQVLGRKIKNLRKIKKKAQVELAKELSFTSTGAISQVENGIRGSKVESTMKAAKGLGVHPIVLLMPGDIDKGEIEIISATFELFEKRGDRPDLVRPLIEEIRKILRSPMNASRRPK